MTTRRQIPPIQARGIRQTCPTGYVIGRITALDGAAQFIPFAALGDALTKSGAIKSQTIYERLTFSAPGLFSNSQQFAMAPAPVKVKFPASVPSSVMAGSPPAGTVTFYLVYNLAAFLASGAPAGVLAQLHIVGGSPTGTVTYPNGSITINAGAILTMVMPASADAALANVVAIFVGDPL